MNEWDKFWIWAFRNTKHDPLVSRSGNRDQTVQLCPKINLPLTSNIPAICHEGTCLWLPCRGNRTTVDVIQFYSFTLIQKYASLFVQHNEPRLIVEVACSRETELAKSPKKSLACGPHHPIWPTWASTKMPQWWLPASQHGQGLFPSPHRSATVLLKRFPLQDSEKNDEYLLSHHIWVKMRYSIRYPPVCMCVHVCIYIYILMG